MRLLLSFAAALLVALALFALMQALIMPPGKVVEAPRELLRIGAVRSVQESQRESRQPQAVPERPAPVQPLSVLQPDVPPVPRVPVMELHIDVPRLQSNLSLNAAPALSNLQPAAQRQAATQAAEAAPAAAASGSAEEVTPLVDIAPEYPRRALAAGIEGSVVLRFTVNAEGRVENLQVVSAAPPGVFERAARRAVRRWRFAPRRENGVAVSRDVIKTLNFRMPTGRQ